MARTFTYKRDLFNPTHLSDLLLSPYNSAVIKGENGTILGFSGGKYLVAKEGLTERHYLETPNEKDAVQVFWRLECGEEIVNDQGTSTNIASE